MLALTSHAALALAQAPSATTTRTASPSFTPKSVGPTVAASKIGVSQVSRASTNPSAAYDKNLGAGRNVALIVVGGAALIIGAVIGGAAGILIAVAGAAVGLYGLYYFVQ